MQPAINVNRRIVIMLAGVIIMAFVGFIIYNTVRRPVAGGYIRIANIREFTRGKPTNRLALAVVEHGLYMKINSFTAVQSNSVKDMKVREGTFEQINDNGYHRVSMLVDSESLRMSFRFFYQWGDEARFEQYGGVIFCVLLEEVIFEDFKCDDMSTIQTGDDAAITQLTDVLPITTTNYRIRANILPRPAEILITVRVPSGQSGSAASEPLYQEALEMLSQTGLDLTQYRVVRMPDDIIPGRD